MTTPASRTTGSIMGDLWFKNLVKQSDESMIKSTRDLEMARMRTILWTTSKSTTRMVWKIEKWPE